MVFWLNISNNITEGIQIHKQQQKISGSEHVQRAQNMGPYAQHQSQVIMHSQFESKENVQTDRPTTMVNNKVNTLSNIKWKCPIG